MDISQFINGVKGLEKKSQVELLRSLLQQLEPEIVSQAVNNSSTITYAEIVINLYLNQDISVLVNLLDAAAYRLKNKVSNLVE